MRAARPRKFYYPTVRFKLPCFFGQLPSWQSFISRESIRARQDHPLRRTCGGLQPPRARCPRHTSSCGCRSFGFVPHREFGFTPQALTCTPSLIRFLPTIQLVRLFSSFFNSLAFRLPPAVWTNFHSVHHPRRRWTRLGRGGFRCVDPRTGFASSSHPLTDEQVNELAYEIEKLHHGTPSGIDNTVITYAKPVYFIKGKPIETFKVGKPFTIVIGDTGIPAPTKESVGDVRRLRMRDQYTIENIFNEIAQIALIGRRSIESGKPELLGELMDQNHEYLQALTVSSPELDQSGRSRAQGWRTGRKTQRQRTGRQYDRVGRPAQSGVGCGRINLRRRKTHDHHRNKIAR